MDFNLISAECAEMIAQKYIRVQQSPRYPELWLLNYTEQAQFAKMWNESTLSARGLIVDDKGNVVARPFRKFFNLSEHASPALEDAPVGEDFVAYEKCDGSMGVCFFYSGEWHISTRGSFVSEQAQFATKLLYRVYADQLPKMNEGITYLFEIIYPENKIVVDYGDVAELVLLGGVVRDTGEDLLLSDEVFADLAFRKPMVFDVDSIESLPSERRNFEGYVIRFSSGLRVKVKLDEYVRLHRIMSSWSDKNTALALKNGDDVSVMLRDLPDEMFDELRGSIDRVKALFASAWEVYMVSCTGLELGRREDRAVTARRVIAFCTDANLNSSVFFALLDNQQARAKDIVWDAVLRGL